MTASKLLATLDSSDIMRQLSHREYTLICRSLSAKYDRFYLTGPINKDKGELKTVAFIGGVPRIVTVKF